MTGGRARPRLAALGPLSSFCDFRSNMVLPGRLGLECGSPVAAAGYYTAAAASVVLPVASRRREASREDRPAENSLDDDFLKRLLRASTHAHPRQTVPRGRLTSSVWCTTTSLVLVACLRVSVAGPKGGLRTRGST